MIKTIFLRKILAQPPTHGFLEDTNFFLLLLFFYMQINRFKMAKNVGV